MSEAAMAEQILTTITSSAAAVKSVVEAIKTARGKAKGNKEALAALLEAQELTLSLQTSLFEAKEQALALQEENRELRAQVRQHEERALDREKYELKTIGRDAAVTPKGAAQPLYCPNCFADGSLRVLSSVDDDVDGPTHLCGACEALFNLHPRARPLR